MREVARALTASSALRWPAGTANSLSRPSRPRGSPKTKEVAAKYAGDKAALAKLGQKVKQGGSGVWGAIPMPPNAVPDADLKTLVEWILALK